MATACLLLAVAALTAYVVLGGADFGAGLWDLTAGRTRHGGPLRALIERSITPVWEANHVWLPFILVILWTAFPPFFGAVMSALYVPLFAALAGIVLRGTAFVLRPHARTLVQGRALGAAFAVSSVVVPFAFGTCVGAIASGRVPLLGEPAGTWSPWLNPTSIAIGVFAVTMCAWLAAVFLAGDASRTDDPALGQATRRRVLLSWSTTGAVALAALAVVHADVPALFDRLGSGAGLALIIGSGTGASVGLLLVLAGAHGWARVAAAGAVVCVLGAWAVAQSPELLPGTLTVTQAAADPATLTALLIVTAAGSLVLVPGLVLLYRLVLHGRLDKPYVPMDRRWRT